MAGYADFAGGSRHAFLYDGATMHDLGTLGGTYSVALGINASGQAAGESYTAGNAPLHAFLYDGTQLNDQGTLGGTESYAYAINAAGQVAGIADTPHAGSHAFLSDGTTMRDLGTLGGAYAASVALGLNYSGQVVGYASIPGTFNERAFYYDGAGMRDLNDLIPPQLRLVSRIRRRHQRSRPDRRLRPD